MRKQSLILMAASIAMGAPISAQIRPTILDDGPTPLPPDFWEKQRVKTAHDLDCLAKAQAKRDRKAKNK